MVKGLLAFTMATALGAGCATIYSSSTADLERSEAALRAAHEAGAAEHASAELELARRKLSLARRCIEAGDLKPAGWLVEQARVDAEVAALKAISARAMRRVSRDIQQLRAQRDTSPGESR